MDKRTHYPNVFYLFTPDAIDCYMRAAHSLYLDKFPNARQPELLNSILPDMPHVTCHEAAGLIHPLSHQAPDEEEVKVEEVEGLCICDLSTLLRSRADHKQCSSALIVTMAGHSTAYLFHQVKTLPLRMGAHWVCTGMRRARKGLRGRMLYVPLTDLAYMLVYVHFGNVWLV